MEENEVIAQSQQFYKFYPGVYPVIVLENSGYSRRAELDLNGIVRQHKLEQQLEELVWIEHIVVHQGLIDTQITMPEVWHLLTVYSFPDEGLRAAGEYIVPDKVIKALLSRCKTDDSEITTQNILEK